MKDIEKKEERKLLKHAKRYFEERGFEICWSRSYKQYLVSKGNEESWYRKDQIILEYLRHKENNNE